jgi:ribosomal protein S18 acetylase RimI-like enzyme
MDDLIIRSAQSSDLDRLNELMYLLHDEHHNQCPEHFKTAAEIEQEKSIARYLDDPECMVLVAELVEKKSDKSIVGFITGHFCELVSTVSKPLQMGSIDELYVESDYRKSRVALQLCQAIEERFDDYGVTQVFVEVWNFNQTALDFYHKFGFEPHIHWLRKSI